jgi:hypothetical protein
VRLGAEIRVLHGAVGPDRHGRVGVDGGRLAVDIPVIGPLRTSVHAALTLADRVGITVPLASHVPYTRRILRTYGLESFITGIKPIGVYGQDVKSRKDEIFSTTTKLIRSLVEEGAEIIERKVVRERALSGVEHPPLVVHLAVMGAAQRGDGESVPLAARSPILRMSVLARRLPAPRHDALSRLDPLDSRLRSIRPHPLRRAPFAIDSLGLRFPTWRFLGPGERPLGLLLAWLLLCRGRRGRREA